MCVGEGVRNWISKINIIKIINIIQARMRILKVSQTLESQKTLGNHSENENVEGHSNAWITETWKSQWECKFWRPAKRLNHRTRLEITARILILKASQTLESRKTIGNLSEDANGECDGTLRNTENTTDPQRKCELRVPWRLQSDPPQKAQKTPRSPKWVWERFGV